MEKHSEIKTLQQAIQYYSDERVCIDLVAASRWPAGPICPACEGREHWYLKAQKRWKCKDCNKQFSVKVGSIFEDSAIPLTKWLPAMWMLANCRNGVSSYEIHRAIGVTQKSAWFMLQRIRLAMKQSGPVGGSGSEVETDETYLGGKLRNMHGRRRAEMRDSGGLKNKTIVMGFLDRTNRRVTAEIIPHASGEILTDRVKQNVITGSTLYTDSHFGYQRCSGMFTHEVVNHLEEYVNGRVHTNGIENFWSLLKRSIGGTYVAVEPCHVSRYVDEQEFRYNNRKRDGKKIPDAERFQMAVKGVSGKRLT